MCEDVLSYVPPLLRLGAFPFTLFPPVLFPPRLGLAFVVAFVAIFGAMLCVFLDPGGLLLWYGSPRHQLARVAIGVVLPDVVSVGR